MLSWDNLCWDFQLIGIFNSLILNPYSKFIKSEDLVRTTLRMGGGSTFSIFTSVPLKMMIYHCF